MHIVRYGYPDISPTDISPQLWNWLKLTTYHIYEIHMKGTDTWQVACMYKDMRSSDAFYLSTFPKPSLK